MTMVAHSPKPSFWELFTPKLVTILREGYRLRDLRADAVAGLTVAIVALPLSMAIAIASGVTPDRGLYTAIVGGFVVSALGGSRFQIGGPAGAFIVLVATTVAVHGVDGLILATFLSGLILLAVGFLRLGTFIKYIPYPVTVGFTAGIAIIILASQLKDLFGLRLNGPEPAALIPKVEALVDAFPTVNAMAVLLATISIGIILAVRRLRPHWPAFLIAVGIGSLVAALFHLPVETIGTRFGGIPNTLPLPHLPDLSLERIVELLPAALSFALLGAIESLLSAVVADSMTGRRHRSNSELVAQGFANMASSLFGGFCVTGTIARTATNVRAGARGPIAGMLHSLFLLSFMLVAAPLASFIPLAALAAVLVIVAWNMAEKREFATLVRASPGDAVVLAATFLIVALHDLAIGILVGFAIAALLFLHRMAQAVKVETGLPGAGLPGAGIPLAGMPVAERDVPDQTAGQPRTTYDVALATDPDVVVYRISGAFFFGAAASVGAALDRIGEHPKAYVIDFSAVPVIDSTAAATIEGFARKAHRQGAELHIAGALPAVRRRLLTHGVRPPGVHFHATLHEAVAAAHHRKDSIGATPARAAAGPPLTGP